MKRLKRFIVFVCLIGMGSLVIGGCSTMEGHMAGGTVLGAGLGAAIGAATGNPAAGAAIGAAAGLLGGTVTGMAQEERNRQLAYSRQAATPSPPPEAAAGNQPFFDYNDRLWKCYDSQGRLLVWQYDPNYGWCWH